MHLFSRKYKLVLQDTLVWEEQVLTLNLNSNADVLRGSSRVPVPRTFAELKDKFLSHCLQISARDHMQIIGDPIGAVEVSVDTPNT